MAHLFGPVLEFKLTRNVTSRTQIWELTSPTFVSDDPQLSSITPANRVNSY